MKISYFGGSFNPPHNGHLTVARRVLESGRAQCVLFAPAYAPPHKTSRPMPAFDDRAAMVKLLIAGEPAMEFCDIENRLKLYPSYTIRVLEALRAERPGDEISLLIGGDSLHDLHLWFHAHELVNEFPILFYARTNRERSAPDQTFWSDAEQRKLLSGAVSGDFLEISSTKIRKALEKSSDAGHIMLEDALPENVLRYAEEEKLYSKGRIET